MKIKVNDKVKILAGRDKGKSGKVLQILPSSEKLVVEGVNLMYKHLRPQKKGEKGQRVQFNGPINISKVLLLCPKCSQAVKVGVKISTSSESKQKTKSRFCKKCQEVID